MAGNNTINDITRQKAELRRHYLKIRKTLDNATRNEKNRVILALLRSLDALTTAKHVLCYISFDAEADTHDLINWMLRQGISVSVPKIQKNGDIRAVQFPGWPEIIQGPLGIPEPGPSNMLDSKIDVCITPGICFNAAGYRLGYGAGFYDRWFENNNVPVKIGIAFEEQIAPQIPVQDHDISVDMIVTEKRIIRVC